MQEPFHILNPLSRTLSRTLSKRKRTVGQPPGSFIHVNGDKPKETLLTLIDYNESDFEEKRISTVDECVAPKEQDKVTWLNLDGLEDSSHLQRIQDLFNIHALVLEDVVHASQRPKFEDHGEYVFIAVRMLSYDEQHHEVLSEQVSLILRDKYVISFQERQGDVFELIRDRLRGGKGRIRKMRADYLVYALLDAIVDNYFVVLERMGDRIEQLEEFIMADGDEMVPERIHRFKRDMIYLRKQVWPLREVMNSWQRSESGLFTDTTDVFVKDVYDHVVQIIDTVELYRDMLSGLHDVYLSKISNKMNEVMKVLTIFAAIFIPLTFIAGVYGMNFEYMPELHFKYGYFVVWGVMITVGVGMLMIFRRKDWI